MCIRPNGQDDGIHSCITSCPLCWIFLSASNKRQLMAGGKIALGTAYELMLAAQEGCLFASFWLEAILRTEHGPRYSEKSTISAFVQDSGRSASGNIKALTLAIQDADGVERLLGDGAVETIYHGHEDTFGVFAFEGSDTGETIKQRFAQPVIDQPRAYETGRQWIAECIFSHPDCPKPNLTAPLPTRVLDVSALGEERVKVFVTEGLGAQYAALSYCWGKTRQLVTTQATLSTFATDGVEISKLPNTLRDAIKVVRKLGIKYLWIDSLCIIQDSDEDKAVEISKMPQIYKGAIVTISAALAKDCNDGFLEHRQGMQDILNYVFALEYFLPDQDDPEAEVFKDDTDTIFISPDADCGFEMKEFSEETIDQRAWTLQESWLAPRILIYGSGPLQWQCLTKSASFGGTPPGGDKELLPTAKRRKFHGEVNLDVDRGDLNSEWRDIVRQYTTRDMTDPRDKLPALSGIAAEFARLSGDIYLAGLWKSSLPYSLLWYHASAPKEKKEILYRAPSWSWASLDGKIIMRSPRTWIANTEVEMESVEVKPLRELAPMAGVASGVLKLRGPVRRMTWQKVQERFVIVDLDQSAHLYWDYIIPDHGLHNPRFKNPQKNGQYTRPGQVVSISVFPPAVIYPVPRVVRDVADVLAAMQIEDGEFVFLEVTRGPEPMGIVLEEQQDGTYKRIGFFVMARRATSQEEQQDGYWSGGERDWDWDVGLDIRGLTIV